MAEVPRVHRVEPPQPLGGQAPRVSESGDRHGSRKPPEREPQEDTLELHEIEAEEDPPPAAEPPFDPEAPTLDIRA